MDKNIIRRINVTKASFRPGMKENDWRRFNAARKFKVTPEEVCARDCLERIDIGSMTKLQFIERYDKTYTPVVITNAQGGWPAREKWTIEQIGQTYRNESFKCGKDSQRQSVNIKMEYYVEYMRHNQDDSPLYIFDGDFGEKEKKKRLLADYVVPIFFTDDVLNLADQKRRPPYRWFIMGPARSGTMMHIDPLGTSAWHALVVGHKWWCLIPNKCPKDLLRIPSDLAGPNCREAIAWFMFVYPKTQQPDWPKEFKPIEILQRPGETVFVPGGWWHAVLNLDDTIAVAQNFCSFANFPVVWHKIARSRHVLARSWLENIKDTRPELAALAACVDPYEAPPLMSDDSGADTTSTSSNSTPSSTDSEQEEGAACDMVKRKHSKRSKPNLNASNQMKSKSRYPVRDESRSRGSPSPRRRGDSRGAGSRGGGRGASTSPSPRRGIRKRR